jgi:hypothetical protein
VPSTTACKAGLTIPVTQKFLIQPMLAYWFPLSNDGKKKVDGNSYNPSGYQLSVAAA